MLFLYLLCFVYCGTGSLLENIAKNVLIKLGCEEEEAGLVATDYLKNFQDLSLDNFVEEATLIDISLFWKEWRIRMCEEITGFRLSIDSELLIDMNYKLMKLMKSDFEDLETEVIEEKQELACGAKESNSFYI